MTTPPNFKQIIAEDQAEADNGLNVHDQYKTWDVEDIKAEAQAKALPYGVCLMSVTGDLNVGTMVRTAHNFGAERVIVFGRRKYDRRSAVGAEYYTPVVKYGGLNDDLSMDPTAFIEAMDAYDYIPVFVETGGHEVRHVDWSIYNEHIWTKHGKKPCFVFGNESRGIDNNILATRVRWEDSYCISVPQLGVMRSFNVAACASIVLYDVVFMSDGFGRGY